MFQILSISLPFMNQEVVKLDLKVMFPALICVVLTTFVIHSLQPRQLHCPLEHFCCCVCALPTHLFLGGNVLPDPASAQSQLLVSWWSRAWHLLFPLIFFSDNASLTEQYFDKEKSHHFNCLSYKNQTLIKWSQVSNKTHQISYS